jgi:hypothetical protein
VSNKTSRPPRSAPDSRASTAIPSAKSIAAPAVAFPARNSTNASADVDSPAHLTDCLEERDASAELHASIKRLKLEIAGQILRQFRVR